MDKRYFISTALPYVNSAPHIGFALEMVQTDALARYSRLSGSDVFFLTGADENSLKNVRAAKEENIPVERLVARNAKRFSELKKALNLSFDDFIRTTEKRHMQGAQKLWLACQDDIYKKSYCGLYCVGCEEFYKPEELAEGKCPEHKTEPEAVSEENYFFKLSKYQDQLQKIIREDIVKVVPQTRKNEVLAFINAGLEDICISRSGQRAQGWGIAVPNDESQKIWVWFDALSNYINALGYADGGRKFQDFWQENEHKLHVIGKGILRFHAIYWIAMLLSAKLSLPKTIFVHGYLTVGGQKISKSLGNVIDPFQLAEQYGCDPIRYFLLREIPPAEDGDFSEGKLETRYNGDLAAGLGNLVARVVNLAARLKFTSPNENRKIENPQLAGELSETWKSYHKYLQDFKFNETLIVIWDLIHFCDKFIEAEKPWQQNNKEQQLAILQDLVFVLANIASLLQPFMPETADKIFNALGVKAAQNTAWKFKVKSIKSLFPKLES